jgi:hypothetical protein
MLASPAPALIRIVNENALHSTIPSELGQMTQLVHA